MGNDKVLDNTSVVEPFDESCAVDADAVDKILDGIEVVEAPKIKRKPGRPKGSGVVPKPDGSTGKPDTKKPGIKMTHFIENLDKVTPDEKRQIYKDAVDWGSDKRNFNAEYYIIAKYGVPQNTIDEWKSNDVYISRLSEVAHDRTKAELLDRMSDMYGGVNTLGAMFILKAVYGMNDKSDTSKLDINKDIQIGYGLAKIEKQVMDDLSDDEGGQVED